MRNQNMNQAFAVHPHRTDYIKNNVILLIDDIATTGATMNAAAQALLNAGASAVHGLCLARSDGSSTHTLSNQIMSQGDNKTLVMLTTRFLTIPSIGISKHIGYLSGHRVIH